MVAEIPEVVDRYMVAEDSKLCYNLSQTRIRVEMANGLATRRVRSRDLGFLGSMFLHQSSFHLLKRTHDDISSFLRSGVRARLAFGLDMFRPLMFGYVQRYEIFAERIHRLPVSGQGFLVEIIDTDGTSGHTALWVNQFRFDQ